MWRFSQAQVWACARSASGAFDWTACPSCRRKSRLRGGQRFTEDACSRDQRHSVIGGCFRSVRSQQQGAGRGAADDADFADAAFDGPLGGFELENHAARNDAALDQALDFLAGDGGKNSFPVENAGDIREIDQLIGAEIFRAGSGHVVGVDVVQLIVGTQAKARRYGQKAFVPKRFDELRVQSGEITDEAEAAFDFVVHYRFGDETTS